MKWHVLALALLLAVLVFEFQQAQDFELGTDQKVHADLTQIQFMDMLSEEHMLRQQSQRINNYDQLTEQATTLSQAYARLAARLADIDKMHEPLQALKDSIDVQVRAIQAFKADLAVLTNSKRYLPVLMAQIGDQRTEMKPVLMQLSRNVFVWLSDMSDDKLKQQIGRQQLAIRAAGLAGLDRHLSILLQYAPRIRTHIDTAIHCGTPENVALVATRFDTLHAQQMRQQENHRLRLIGLIVLLLAYLGALLYRLGRNIRRLNATNHALAGMQAKLEHDLQARTEAEKRFRTLVDSSSAAIMTFAGGQFVSANPATLAMFGCASKADFLCLHPTDVSPPLQPDGSDSVIAAGKYIEEALRDGSCVFEWMHRRINGECFPAQVQLTALQVDGEQVVQGIVADLSELHQMQAEKDRLAAALAYTSEGVLITDAEVRIVYVNPAFEQLTGYTAGEAQGRFASIMRSEAKDDAIYDEIVATVNGGKVWKGELLLRRSDGEELLTDRSITPIMNAEGEIVNHISILRDITEERQRSRRLEHTQRLESLGVLAGGIAHDFNNILTAIMGNAALGRKKMQDSDPALTHLVRIEDSSQRAAELCNQMLAYSGKGRFQVKTVGLSQTVEEIIKLLGVSIAKNVVLKLYLAENLPPIEADVAQLQQVIMNLVINASDAIAKKSGVISLSSGMMQVDGGYLEGAYVGDDVKPGPFVFLEVADTGCGMDEPTQKKIFDPFFTTKFTGRGLGMSAVLGIVRGHHGAIKVYSEVGQGTTFKVLLPASTMQLSDEQQSDTWSDWCGIGTILVVDDEETIRETAALMLQDMGFDTLTAEDGEQGVAVYRQHQDKIVAVLLDMTMPKLDGKGCFRELRRINKDVRVVLSSGYNEQDATNRFAGQGLAGFVQKPYSPEALRDRIAAVLESSFNVEK
ncbi:MAG: PAS domain S-box protein [Mariprofundaceae bacterium]